MVERWLVGIVALAGCDKLFGLDVVTARDAPPGEPMLACPAGYDLQSTISPSRYRDVQSTTTWETANTACNSDGERTHLLVLSDETERLDVLELLANKGESQTIWIGLTDRNVEDAFLWVTAEPVGIPVLRQTPPWSPDQPDNFNGVQDCVSIVGSAASDGGLFDDGTCDSRYHYVCECDGWMPEPGNY